MASLVLKNVTILVNTKDLTAFLRSQTLNYGASEQDDTAMGDDSESVLPGLKNWSLDLEFNQDFAASEVDATLFPLVGADPFAVTIKPTSAAIGATNPSYQGNAILTSYTPLQGAVGELAKATVRLKGTGTLARVVTGS